MANDYYYQVWTTGHWPESSAHWTLTNAYPTPAAKKPIPILKTCPACDIVWPIKEVRFDAMLDGNLVQICSECYHEAIKLIEADRLESDPDEKLKGEDR